MFPRVIPTKVTQVCIVHSGFGFGRFGRRICTAVLFLLTGGAILAILAVPAHLAWPKLLLAIIGESRKNDCLIIWAIPRLPVRPHTANSTSQDKVLTEFDRRNFEVSTFPGQVAPTLQSLSHAMDPLCMSL